jgi:hypothetical protein
LSRNLTRLRLASPPDRTVRMKISTEEQYRNAMTELQQLADASPDDQVAQHRRRVLEAATAHYAEKLRADAPRKARPGPTA